MKMTSRVDSSHGVGVENQHQTTKGRVENSKLVRITCPYNPSHSYPKSNHTFHLVHCPDRIDKMYHRIVVVDTNSKGIPTLRKLSSMPVDLLDEASCVGYNGRSPPPFAVIERPKMSEAYKRRQLIKELLLRYRNSSKFSAPTQPKNISEQPKYISEYKPSVPLKPSLTIPYEIEMIMDEKMKLRSSYSKKVDSTLTIPNYWNLPSASNTQPIQKLGLQQVKPCRIAANIFGNTDRGITQMNLSSCRNSVKGMNNCHLNPKQPVHQNPGSLYYDYVQSYRRGALGFTPLEPLNRSRRQNEALLYKWGCGRGVLPVTDMKPSSCSNKDKFPKEFCFTPIEPLIELLIEPPIEPLIQIHRPGEEAFSKQACGRGVLHVPEVKPSNCSNSVKDTNDNVNDSVKDANDNVKDTNDNVKNTNGDVKDTNVSDFIQKRSVHQHPIFLFGDYPLLSSTRVPITDMKSSSSNSTVKDTINSIKDSDINVKDSDDNVKDENDNVKDENDNVKDENDNVKDEDDNFTDEDDSFTDEDDSFTDEDDNFTDENDCQPVHQNPGSFDYDDFTVLDCER